MSRYEVLERIGAGRVAEVFRGVATSDAGFEKRVAIKKILPHLASDTRFVRLLVDEAMKLASLRHRNIVSVHDVGLSDVGEYFLVMEYVDGRALGELLDRMARGGGRFPQDVALHLVSELCEALDYAHRAGLVHRDVSPASILVSYAGEVKLTDFLVDDGGVLPPHESPYLSPEQAHRAPVDRRSDVYSLGLVLYELLLGLPAVDPREPRAAAGRLLRPGEIDAQFPRDLERIVMNALAHDPAQRWPTAGALGAAIRDYRYSTATGMGDPARQLALLVRRHLPDETAGRHPDERPPDETGTAVLRITTVAGFRPAREPWDGEPGAEAAPRPAGTELAPAGGDPVVPRPVPSLPPTALPPPSRPSPAASATSADPVAIPAWVPAATSPVAPSLPPGWSPPRRRLHWAWSIVAVLVLLGLATAAAVLIATAAAD